jgi:lipopolysaccharide/colanic/teichoic acid biosynthesis glycosyltransferase
VSRLRLIEEDGTPELESVHPVIAIGRGRNMRLRRQVKRAFDLAAAIAGLAVTWPLFPMIAIAIKLDSRGPVMFNRTRVGKNGQLFVMFKFRTMEENAEHRLQHINHLNMGGPYMIKIPDDPRVTRVGRILRKTSLDELPQLINVIRGEMSLVGPRPQAPNEVAMYNDRQRRRLAVVPGITGLWQVTSRDDPSFERWVELDLEYSSSWSLKNDFLILLKTVGTVLKAKGGHTKSSAAKE